MKIYRPDKHIDEARPLCPTELQELADDILKYCRKHGMRPIYGGNLEMRAAIWLHYMGLGWLTIDGFGQASFQTERVLLPAMSIVQLAENRRSV